jgi:hypothetical protein
MASRPIANAPDQSGKRLLANDYSLLSMRKFYEQKSGPSGSTCHVALKGGFPLAARSSGTCSWPSTQGVSVCSGVCVWFDTQSKRTVQSRTWPSNHAWTRDLVAPGRTRSGEQSSLLQLGKLMPAELTCLEGRWGGTQSARRPGVREPVTCTRLEQRSPELFPRFFSRRRRVEVLLRVDDLLLQAFRSSRQRWRQAVPPANGR